MKNAEGKLLTSDKDILNEAVKHYKKVFEPTQIKDSLEHVQKARETLCDERLAEASTCKTPPWSVEDVKNVLKQLKPGKSKDPYDFPNKIFRPDVAGEDLILALTKLLNRIKSELIFPSPMNVCNVTNLF